MAIAKSVFAFLVFATTASQIFGQVNVPRTNQTNSARDTFLNRTLSQIPAGVCITEVPTASLVADPRNGIPIGNGSTPAMSRIHVCCEGFERHPHIFRKCIPVCSQDCVNGICVAPNRCQCYPDHVLNLAGYCVATCPIGCFNGECDSNVCRCKPGYQLDPKRNCTEPNVCECRAGWSLDETGSNCVPGCSRPCLNGVCGAADTCTCNKGYVLDTVDPFKCNAFCENGCPNGVCSAPNACLCNLGFVKDRSVRGSQNCVPHQ